MLSPRNEHRRAQRKIRIPQVQSNAVKKQLAAVKRSASIEEVKTGEKMLTDRVRIRERKKQKVERRAHKNKEISSIERREEDRGQARKERRAT